jgi:hypothetical protein
MGLSYEEVLVDVVRYKYLCSEGFISPPSHDSNMRFRANGFFRHLVECIAQDTGMACDLVACGLVHSALQHGRLDATFFEAVVTQLYA